MRGVALDLTNLRVEARPRNHWEAVDLGCLMARQWWGRLLGAWLFTAVPVLLLVLLVARSSPVLGALLLWWFKPLYERLPLMILGEEVFGESRPLLEVARDRKSLTAGLWQSLTYLRLSPNRAFNAPVWVLEGLRGNAGVRRRELLRRSTSTASPWLTVLGIHVETFVSVSLVLLLMMLVPDSVDVDWMSFWTDGELVDSTVYVLFSLGLQVVTMAVIAPFYVAAGFSLYMNRRVELEAWDIELKFRRIASRVMKKARNATAPVSIGLLCVALFTGFLPAPVKAESLSPPDEAYSQVLEVDDQFASSSPLKQESREIVDEVLASDDFGVEETTRYPKFLECILFQENCDESELDIDQDLDWLGSFGRLLGGLTELLLWVLAIGLAVWLVYLSRFWDRGALPRSASRLPDYEVMGFRLDEQSLPDDVVAAANVLWTEHRPREAIALLYRGALTRLIQSFGCEFSRGDTETDCLVEVGSQTPERVSVCFKQLTRSWTRLAYGHKPIDVDSFQTLCNQWPVFDIEPRREPS